MSAIFRCDLCKRVDASLDINTEHCSSCSEFIRYIKLAEAAKVGKTLEAKYGSAIRNRVHVLGLMQWLLDEVPDEFMENFGTQGLDMLREALGTENDQTEA